MKTAQELRSGNVIMVGSDPASAVYVRNKRRACAQVGFRSFDHDLPADTGEAELERSIGSAG